MDKLGMIRLSHQGIPALRYRGGRRHMPGTPGFRFVFSPFENFFQRLGGFRYHRYNSPPSSPRALFGSREFFPSDIYEAVYIHSFHNHIETLYIPGSLCLYFWPIKIVYVPLFQNIRHNTLLKTGFRSLI